MSYKNKLVKMALNYTPKCITLWAANKKLKGMAELTDFNFDAGEGKLYTQLLLAGEQEPVDIWLKDLTLITDEEPCKLVVQEAESNRPWLDALLTRVVIGREWKIRDSHVELIQELLASECIDEND